ncbi:ATP-binding protein [Streptomyces sp. NBC_01465]
MTLPADPASVATARREFLVSAIRLDLVGRVDECVLMLSELVTNAIAHGCAEEPWLVRVEWHRTSDALRVEVHNPGLPGPVQLVKPRQDDEHGRGLLLVDALAYEWSVGPSPHGGTVVAFVMRGALR